MRVANFQLQIPNTDDFNAHTVLMMIDRDVPEPQPVEGGDENCRVFKCVLRDDKVEALQTFCAENPSVRIYSEITYSEYYDFYYNHFWNINWVIESPPT